MAWNICTNQTNKNSLNSHYIDHICCIWNQLMNIQTKKITFPSFTFFKQYFLGLLHFGQKTPCSLKMYSKYVLNHLIALFSILFWHEKIHFLTLSFFLGPLTWNRLSVCDFSIKLISGPKSLVQCGWHNTRRGRPRW